MGKPSGTEKKEALYQAILNLKDMDECHDFFEDLCTVKEMQVMEQRFEVAKMLKKDKVYTEIVQKTKASSATISRVKRMLNYGTGCLGRMLDELENTDEEQ